MDGWPVTGGIVRYDELVVEVGCALSGQGGVEQGESCGLWRWEEFIELRSDMRAFAGTENRTMSWSHIV